MPSNSSLLRHEGAMLLFLVLSLFLAPTCSATPREELLRFVPEDVGFCVVVQDLRDHSAAILNSPFAEQVRGSPLSQLVADAPEMQKLLQVERQFQKHFQVGWAELRDDILGDAVVLAYKPGPVGKPELEQGLILVHARDPQLLAQLIEKIHEAQKKSGELKELQTREHAGQTYFHRVTTKETSYYFLRGPILAYATHEAMLHRAIGQRKEATAESPVSKHLQSLTPAGSLASLWINPRAFLAELEHRLAAAKGPEAAFLRNFLHYWRAVDGFGLHLTPGKDLAAGLTFKARPENLPPSARRFLAELAKPSELWNVFPENALLAVAARVDAVALTDLVGEFLTPEARQSIAEAVDDKLGAALGKDIGKEILPYLGPDVGLCITAPDPTDKGWMPHIVAALRVQPGPDGRVDQLLFSALNSYAMLIVIDHNGKNADKMMLRSTMQDRIEVKYLVNEKRFPPGLQPAFALKGGYLVLGSSPEAIRRFNPDRPTPPSPRADGSVPLLRMSLRDLRNYIQERKESLAEYAAQAKQLPPEQIARRLEALLLGLQFLDRIELTMQTGAKRPGLALRVRPARPLRE